MDGGDENLVLYDADDLLEEEQPQTEQQPEGTEGP